MTTDKTVSDASHSASGQDINAFMLYGGLTYTVNSLETMPAPSSAQDSP